MRESNFIKSIEIAHQWYSKKKFEHGIRVARYAVEMAEREKYPHEYIQKIFVIGLLHDILEDTDCPCAVIHKLFGSDISMQIKLLTKEKDVDYHTYCQNILQSGHNEAIIVKRADFKDHLTLRETLTEKLKEKYVMEVGDFL